MFAKNSDKIGLLGRDVAGQLVRFYANIDGIREDIKSLGDGETGRLSRQGKIRMIEDALTLLTLLSEAKEIAAQLKRTL